MKYYKWLRLTLIVVPIIALGVFSYQYINPSGVLEVDYDFCKKETPYFSGLSPQGRVLELDTDNCQQQMVIDPVYFDVRLPQSFRQMIVKVTANKETGQLLTIGVGIDPDNWQWQFGEQLKCIDPADMCWLVDLVRAKFEHNRYRFIISSPALSESKQAVIFKNIQLKFQKEPLSLNNLGNRIKNFLDI